MFSVEPILTPVRVPILLCFSEHDEYVPDKVGQKACALRMIKLLKKTSPRVECRYFSCDHGLSKLEYFERFVNGLCYFLSSLS